MEVTRHHDEETTPKAGERRNASSVSINSDYFALFAEGQVVVQSLGGTRRTSAVDRVVTSVADPILSLATSASKYLAISRNVVIDIYDIDLGSSRRTLLGARRRITALDWSPCGSYMAGGSIDGSLYIWNLIQPHRPIARCVVKPGVIQRIAWYRQPEKVVAVVTDSGLHLWDTEHAPRCVVTSSRKDDQLKHLIWSKHHFWTLLAITVGGMLCVWDLATEVDMLKHDTATTRPKVAPVLASPNKLFRNVLYVRWISEEAVALLYNGGKAFAVVDMCRATFGSIDWELEFSHAFEAFTIESDGERAQVRMVSREKQRTYPLPGRWDNVEAVKDTASKDNPRTDVVPQSALPTQTMTPVPISRLRKTNDKRQKHEPQQRVIAPYDLSDSLSTLRPEPLATPYLSPVLGRTPLSREESDSPMPFLSPAIPAKRAAARTDNMPAMDSMILPGSHSDGYFGSFSSATAHDSDSDDDGFDPKASKDNTRLMPGGSNVPLPRSCGAIFASNGDLVLFRPPQVKVIPDKDISGTEQIDRGDNEQIARLFPTFGNLFAEMANFTAVPSIMSIHEGVEHGNMVAEALGLHKASFISRESWKPHSLSALSATRPAANLPSVEISIRRIQDAALVEQQLAAHYRVLVQHNEHGSSMCLANAAIAIRYGCEEDVLIWQTLAKVIEETELSSTGAAHTPTGWSDHPFGSSWLVRRMFAVVEAHGNLQMLACIAAVLLGSVASHHLYMVGDMTTRLAVRTSSLNSTPKKSLAFPALKTEVNGIKSHQSSPIKTYTNSALSSRGPSLPTTPKLESSSSTPPWSFASLTQSGSKLSFPSSMSPENTRSSFSAAVKSYAQSVSDKFASYGTSPPIRKGNRSPNTELSSSLPGAGSWTKSVSFASTTDTRRPSATAAVIDDDGYDSDRTVDDAIVGTDPRKPADTLVMVYKNRDAFSGEISGSAVEPLIPQDLVLSCKIWACAYAERLRSWQLDVQAVEFDKVGAALAGLLAAKEETSAPQQTTPALLSSSGICYICCCAIHGLQQVCRSCQHGFHMVCLGEIMLHGGKPIECPTGCGCSCAFDG